MEKPAAKWARTVFRARGIPNTIKNPESAASFLHAQLRIPLPASIRVFSLATALSFGGIQTSVSKVATVKFLEVPRLILDDPGAEEWSVSIDADFDLILDTHFIGMTPLNEVTGADHVADCIAISGLSSHPFGSWQPKGADHSFMWIRDSLPKHLRGTRALLYGYNTKLHESNSFQRIPDLARELINQLSTYGWGTQSSVHLAFLAHSLGGLVLKQALVELDKSQDPVYKNILAAVRGSVCFGVPNLGMEQTHFYAIVHTNPNEALVRDIGEDSNYLRRLDQDFAKRPFKKRIKCYWAFETAESPTVVRTADLGIDRNGPPAILVSRESATCRLLEEDSSLTFPINATHSDMVKFTKDSHYYHVVVFKLTTILSPSLVTQQVAGETAATHNPDPCEEISSSRGPVSTGATGNPSDQIHSGVKLQYELESFRRLAGLTVSDNSDFAGTTSAQVQSLVGDIQAEQERRDSLMYMRRLEPFLDSMQKFNEAAKDTATFSDLPQAMAYVWGPASYILRTVSTVDEALNAVLDAYQRVGEQIPIVQNTRLSQLSPLLRAITFMIWKDVLRFHQEIIRRLTVRQWEELFKASWRDLEPVIDHIWQCLQQIRRLLESSTSVLQFDEICRHRQAEMRRIEAERSRRDSERRGLVSQWLPNFNCEAVQEQFREKRSICKDPGRWLVDDQRFRHWFDLNSCRGPLLWLSGIPGAGKTVLASIVVDEARRLRDANVVFFYCKHDEETRNTFISVARSVLAQLLAQNPHLLAYLHEKASLTGDEALISKPTAKEMIRTALLSCGKTYIILDGLDECPRAERIEISNFFRDLIESAPPVDMDPWRCLFVSQNDGVALESFRHIPAIKISDENQHDLMAFAQVWHARIETKFKGLREKNYHIANIIAARAQGMFIFAELFAKYLEDQFSLKDLIAELCPERLPVKLDYVYERILQRILDCRSDHVLNPLKQVLGWIVCARRSLQWREIQAAFSLSLEDERVDHDRQISESPKGLFASLVEVHVDGTVELVHGTAREYLIRTKFINPREVDYSMTLMCLEYLCLPQVHKGRSDIDTELDLVEGTHPFYDYASACWAMHLQSGTVGLEPGTELEHLQETLETFIDTHWSATHQNLPDLRRIQKVISPLQKSESFDKITQAVGWARKQAGKHGQGPTKDEALDLWQVTANIRSVLERMHTNGHNTPAMQRFYGQNWFKCPRVNCYSYHHGFPTRAERDSHTNRHDRPYLCIVSACPYQTFGFAAADELKKHLFEYHAIDLFDNDDDNDFPDPPKEKASSTNTTKAPSNFSCHLCNKKFTRNHNLKVHLRTHDGIKPYACTICGERFTRKPDCDRHERACGDKPKPYVCGGPLADGGKWGCQVGFARPDKLADHLRSGAGQKCLKPLVLEKLKTGSGGEDPTGNIFGDQADALLAVGKMLPSFGEFCALCGLDRKIVGLDGKGEGEGEKEFPGR